MGDGRGSEYDLMPPDFAEGLGDWSRGDGTPDSPTYERAENVRIAVGDVDFGTCLELRKTDPIQRLRYMGEMPVPPQDLVEIGARLKVLRGPLPQVRIAAWAGGRGGCAVAGLPLCGPARSLRQHDAVHALRVFLGREARPGVHLVWDERVLYAHIGLDLLGPSGSVLRIERIAARTISPEVLTRPDLFSDLTVSPRPAAG